jgi:hypothetical protein
MNTDEQGRPEPEAVEGLIPTIVTPGAICVITCHGVSVEPHYLVVEHNTPCEDEAGCCRRPQKSDGVGVLAEPKELVPDGSSTVRRCSRYDRSAQQP